MIGETMIIIRHGSGVEEAIADLLEGKTLVKPPYKDLKTDQVRDLVDAYSQIWPEKNPVLIAGPLDEANPQTLDILLKRIEEPFPNCPELILWAKDYGSVPETIRSRCGEKYYYAPPKVNPLIEISEALYKAKKSENLISLCDSLKKIKKGQYRTVLEGYVDVIIEQEDLTLYDEGLKQLLKRNRLSQVSLYGYFIGLD